MWREGHWGRVVALTKVELERERAEQGQPKRKKTTLKTSTKQYVWHDCFGKCVLENKKLALDQIYFLELHPWQSNIYGMILLSQHRDNQLPCSLVYVMHMFVFVYWYKEKGVEGSIHLKWDRMGGQREGSVDWRVVITLYKCI